uniref:YBD domain-containing protein n=1 Tax=Macrostomum lignano TaxID=282301 RepID=A0A1I8FPH3_9PLAT
LADPADSSQQQQQQRRPDGRLPRRPRSPPLECVDVSQIADKFPSVVAACATFWSPDRTGPYLVKFWADINTPIRMRLALSTDSGPQRLTLSCSTKVCSFGRQVVEKVEKHIGPRLESGRYRSKPDVRVHVNFITKLRQLPEKYMMNTVLENFTILQVINCESSGDSLLCIAYVFEVSSGAAQHHVYRLSRG